MHWQLYFEMAQMCNSESDKTETWRIKLIPCFCWLTLPLNTAFGLKMAFRLFDFDSDVLSPHRAPER